MESQNKLKENEFEQDALQVGDELGEIYSECVWQTETTKDTSSNTRGQRLEIKFEEEL